MITEAEAKTKWCPHSRHAVPIDCGLAGGAFNRAPCNPGVGVEHCRCLGSDCMAWRWHEAPKDVFVSVRSLGTIAGFEEKGWTRGEVSDQRGDGVPTVRMSLAPERRTGYCGLAGAP